MKTYTFKIKVNFDKVVIAVNMELEQFFDSVKMTNFTSLVERYPDTYITACDYYADDAFISEDYAICKLKTLLNSHDLKAFLLDRDFNGFVGDDYYSREFSDNLELDASNFIEAEKNIVEDEEDEDSADVPETTKE